MRRLSIQYKTIIERGARKGSVVTLRRSCVACYFRRVSVCAGWKVQVCVSEWPPVHREIADADHWSQDSLQAPGTVCVPVCVCVVYVCVCVCGVCVCVYRSISWTLSVGNTLKTKSVETRLLNTILDADWSVKLIIKGSVPWYSHSLSGLEQIYCFLNRWIAAENVITDMAYLDQGTIKRSLRHWINPGRCQKSWSGQ